MRLLQRQLELRRLISRLIIQSSWSTKRSRKKWRRWLIISRGQHGINTPIHYQTLVANQMTTTRPSKKSLNKTASASKNMKLQLMMATYYTCRELWIRKCLTVRNDLLSSYNMVSWVVLRVGFIIFLKKLQRLLWLEQDMMYGWETIEERCILEDMLNLIQRMTRTQKSIMITVFLIWVYTTYQLK